MNTYSSTLMQERSSASTNGENPASGRVRPIRVALVNDYELILRGLHSMLSPFADRIEVVEHDTSGTPDREADVALFDTFASRRDALERARQMIAEGKVKHVVLYTFDAADEFLAIARDIGVSGVVLKSATGEVLATAIERVVAGERVGLDDVVRATRSRTSKDLSPREQEVLALLALGRTNAEIGEQLFLSVDTVKTYVRRVFAKLGVNNRTQAAMHAAERSLTPRNGAWLSRDAHGRRPSGVSERPNVPG
ncbi:MAG TPA: response regulator transcription factor [Ilumatobacter sp.]|nr:response regulator transcription factor [Ilumatobacter sp.]